jgi:hypothetical protein
MNLIAVLVSKSVAITIYAVAFIELGLWLLPKLPAGFAWAMIGMVVLMTPLFLMMCAIDSFIYGRLAYYLEQRKKQKYKY